jgi:hypothetical protein
VVEPSAVFAPELGLPGRFRLVHDVEELGVSLWPNVVVDAVSPEGVHHRDGVLEADTVIAASPQAPERSLLSALDREGIVVAAIGDCVSPRGLEGATQDALAAAHAWS